MKLTFVTPAAGEKLSFTEREIDGLTFPTRAELRVAVEGGDGMGEVTFVAERSSRPGEYTLIGTDDAPPYRVFWRPPADVQAEETFRMIATFNDLRGGRAVAALEELRIAGGVAFGIRGALPPQLIRSPAPLTEVDEEQALVLEVTATGTAPLEFQWFHDDDTLVGATEPVLRRLAGESVAGHYRVLVRNRAGTTLSHVARVRLARDETGVRE